MARTQNKEIKTNDVIENVTETKEEIKTTSSNGSVTITCKDRANKKVFGLDGELISFDSDGKATVSEKQANYFKTLPNVK